MTRNTLRNMVPGVARPKLDMVSGVLAKVAEKLTENTTRNHLRKTKMVCLHREIDCSGMVQIFFEICLQSFGQG